MDSVKDGGYVSTVKEVHPWIGSRMPFQPFAGGERRHADGRVLSAPFSWGFGFSGIVTISLTMDPSEVRPWMFFFIFFFLLNLSHFITFSTPVSTTVPIPNVPKDGLS